MITDIHGNLPALEAALARIEGARHRRIYCGGDLVGYGPWPNEVCELIQERAIPTIYGNYDYAIGRDEEDCMCAYPNQHDRDLGQLSVDWTLEHTNQASKDFMRAPALRPSLRARRPASPPRARLPEQGQRVPVRGQAARRPSSESSPAPNATDGLRPYPQALDPRIRRGPLRQLRLGGQAEGRRPARRRSRSWRAPARGSPRRIERFDYDAAYAAGRGGRVGAPRRVRREAAGRRVARFADA